MNMITNNTLEKKKQHIYDKYKLLTKLGSGSFGDVYSIYDKKTKKEYAMKVEKNTEKSRLKKEYKIYSALEKNNNVRYIPKIIDYFDTVEYCIMVMELLGRSLDQIYTDNENDFDLQSVLTMGVLCVTSLENIHNAGYIHRDIKPNNFLTGIGKYVNRIYLMDFGLSKKYIVNDEHIKMHTDRSLVGTARYASINVHMGYEPSRRDDLESVGYMLIYFLKKMLPWQGLKRDSSKTEDHIKLIGECKMKTSIQELCQGLPICFNKYIEYCRELKFEAEPDYYYLKKLFVKTAEQYNVNMKFTWK